MFRKHYSDEQLLAHLDGEISPREKARIERHLASCWDCRTRRAQLETAIHRVAAALAAPGIPEPGWPEAARREFHRRVSAYECAAPVAVSRPWRRGWWAAAAAVLLCAAGIFTWRAMRGEPASTMVARVRAAESRAVAGAFHQAVRVEIVPLRPASRAIAGRIEVWSAGARGAYAARWERDGALQYGVWRNAAGAEHFHGAEGVRLQPASLLRFGSRGLDPPDIERELLDWLASRRWRPLELGDGFAAFTAQDGVRLHAERSGGVLRLTARRGGAQLVTEWCMEVSGTDYRPRLHRIRLETRDRAVELRLTVEASEPVDAALLPARLFLPPAAPAAAHIPRTPLPPPPIPVAAEPPEAEITSAAIEAEYALHRAGACLGEPIEVVRTESGRITVRGLVETAARKQQIEAALAGLPLVDAAIDTVSERASSAPGATPLPAPTTVPAPSLPIQSQLEAYFRGSVPAAEAPKRIAAFADEANTLAASLEAEAWAIERLERRYPPASLAAVRPAQRWLFESMLEDHAQAAAAASGKLTVLLQPLLGGFAASASAASASGLLDAASAIGRNVRFLFTGSPALAIPPAGAAGSLLETLTRAGTLALDVAGRSQSARAPVSSESRKQQ